MGKSAMGRTALSAVPGNKVLPPSAVLVDQEDHPLRIHKTSKDGIASKTDLYTSSSGKLCNRLIVCLFAVCLLWLTSLQVCVAIVGFNITVPSFTAVASSCNYAYSKVTEQRDYYATCARRQVEKCHSQLSDAYIEEKMAVSSAQHSNQRFTTAFHALVTNCSDSVAMSKKAITAWSSTGVQYTIPYRDTCTGQDRQKVVTSLGDNSNSRTSVYAASLAYTQSSDSTIERMADYSTALSAYSAEYLNNKTQQLQRLAESVTMDASLPHMRALNVSLAPVERIVDILIACVTLSETSTTCPYSTNLMSTFNDMRTTIVANFGVDMSFMKWMTSSWNFVTAQIPPAIAAANAFYDSVQGAQGIIKWISDNTGVKGICGKTSPSFCSFSTDDWQIAIKGFPPIPTPYIPPVASELWAMVSSLPDVERAKLAAIQAGISREISAWSRDVRRALQTADFTPHDYNPPKYPAARNISQESALQAERSSAFVEDVAAILSSTNTTSETLAAAAKTINTTALLDLTSSSLSGYTFTWADFSTAAVDVALLVESFLTAQSAFYLFDYIYRTFLTVRLVARFWGRGSVKLPKVDLRSKKPDIAATWFTCVQWVLQLLPFVSMQLMLLAAFVVFVLWGFAALFVPEYSSYMGSCVHHTSNHTFLSRNLNSLAFNYATGEGSGVISRGLGKYNTQVTQYCSNSAASSLQTYTALVNQLYAANQTLEDNRNQGWDMQRCIDVPALDASFYQACCTAHSTYEFGAAVSEQCTGSALQCPQQDSSSHEAYQPPGFYLSSDACGAKGVLSEYTPLVLSNAWGATVPATFDCQALPKCVLTCSGPDPLLIEALSKHCSCMSEWFLNGAVVQSLVALLAYLLMNLSRMLVTKGIVQIFWRDLTPATFEYTADCDEKGRAHNTALRDEENAATIGGADRSADTGKSSKRNDFSHALEATIAAQVEQYVRMGYGWIALGLLVNVGWIVPMFLVRRNIAYTY